MTLTLRKGRDGRVNTEINLPSEIAMLPYDIGLQQGTLRLFTDTPQKSHLEREWNSQLQSEHLWLINWKR